MTARKRGFPDESPKKLDKQTKAIIGEVYNFEEHLKAYRVKRKQKKKVAYASRKFNIKCRKQNGRQ